MDQKAIQIELTRRRQFVVPDECRPLLELQLTQTKLNPTFPAWASDKEFRCFADAIGEPTVVLDHGCGLGRMSVWMNWNLPRQAHYILSDASARTVSPQYGWNPGMEYYSDLGLTEAFVRVYGLLHFQTHDIRGDDHDALPPADVVISMRSVGFHYPLEGPLPWLIERAHPHATFVFGVRKGRYDETSFAHRFEHCELRCPFAEPPFDVEEILILRGLK